MAQGALLPGAVNENPPHRLGGGDKEVRSVLEFRRLIADEPQPGLVDERSRLQRVSRRFTGHFARSEPTQFFIDQGQQLVGGFGIAAFDGAEK
jgi:hypothetical protein